MTMRTWFQAWLVCSVLYAVHTENCPDGWVRFHESCYFFGDEYRVDFTEANHFCAAHSKSHLAVIESESENNLVVDYAQRLYKPGPTSTTGFWLGGSDEEVEGSWVWLTTHQTMSAGYTHWLPGQPEHGVPDEDCLCLFPPFWHDCICSEKYHPVCEKNSTENYETEVIG